MLTRQRCRQRGATRASEPCRYSAINQGTHMPSFLCPNYNGFHLHTPMSMRTG